MLRTALLSSCLALSLLAPSAFAAPPDATGLRQVYQAQLTALATEDAPALASTLDPNSCETLKSLLLSAGRKEPATLPLLFGGTLDTLETTPACELLARVSLRMSKGANAAYSAKPKTEVLGIVMEGSSVAHAVMRTTYTVRDVPLQVDELVSFKQGTSGWKIGSNQLVTSLSLAFKAKGL